MFPRFANTAVLETSAVFVHPTPQQKVDLGSRSRSSKDIALNSSSSSSSTTRVVITPATPHTDANSIQKDNHQLSTQFKKTKRGPAFRAK